MKENQHAARCSLLVEKQRIFISTDSQPEKSLSRDGWCRSVIKKIVSSFPDSKSGVPVEMFILTADVMFLC